MTLGRCGMTTHGNLRWSAVAADAAERSHATMADVSRRYHDIDAVAPQWDELADEVGAAPFLRPGWIQAWTSAFDARGLTVYTVWRDGGLVALVPLLVRRRNVTSPANVHTPFWGLLARDDIAVVTLVRSILNDRPTSVTFENLDVESPSSIRCMDLLEEYGFQRVVDQRMRSPFTDVAVRSELFQSRLGKNRRKTLRKQHRRLAEKGALTLDVRDGSTDLQSLLAEGYRVEASGWKGRQHSAITSQRATREFYTSVAQWAAERDWLRLAYLRLDDRAIAFDFLVRAGGALYDLKGGFDDDLRSHSPSKVLFHHILTDAIGDVTRSFEWLGHEEPYKLEWSDGVRDRVSVTWFAPSFGGRSKRRAHLFRRALVGQIRTRLPDHIEARAKTIKNRASELLA